jgi:hypothetical protein
MQGLIEINSINWLDPELSPTPKYDVLNYNKDLGQRAAKDKA